MNPNSTEILRVCGMMSGTSLDGMDLAACTFSFHEEVWNFTIEHVVTAPYSVYWKDKLATLIHAGGAELAQAHFDFGRLSGEIVRDFISRFNFDPILIASHGQTIFHDPAHGSTFQLGNGAAIAAICGKPVVCDFRAGDVCLGGQGAPLVPIGDQLLFHQYDACLNLGGFSNISFSKNSKRIAFDICPVNTVLNYLAGKLKLSYDADGAIARSGEIIEPLLGQLNALDFYTLPAPKSLGMEWLNKIIIPILDSDINSIPDLLRTLTEHIVTQIAGVIQNNKIGKVLITGGGAHNSFLIERLKELSHSKLIIPDAILIDYKEALIFAFLGLLRWQGKINCLASATGARCDSIGGAVYLPPK